MLIKLKEERTVVEEANMAEIEDARTWLPNIEGSFIPLVGYWNGAEGQLQLGLIFLVAVLRENGEKLLSNEMREILI